MDSRVINQLVELVAQTIAEKEPGTVLTHAWLSNETNAKIGTNQYYRIVNLIKKRLLRDRVHLITKHKQGYRVAYPDEQIGLCEGEYIRGMKIQGRAVNKANHIAYDQLTETVKNDAIQRTQRMANVLAMIERALPMPAAGTSVSA